jgi:hypothetical protein
MVLNTSPDVGDLREVMSFVYDEIYVEYIAKNPLHSPGQPFQWVPRPPRALAWRARAQPAAHRPRAAARRGWGGVGCCAAGAAGWSPLPAAAAGAGAAAAGLRALTSGRWLRRHAAGTSSSATRSTCTCAARA